MITGAQLFVKALNEENVDTLFAYPGGQIIDLLDELYNDNSINMILPRHEQGLAHAADGYARSSGKPGVCLVTSGPGATNLVTAIATANYDAVPLVCFTGQVVTSLFAITVRNREELGAIIRKAFVIAQSGKPGSVLVDIPKDIQQQLGSEEYPIDIQRRDTLPTLEQQNKQINKAIESLQSAKRPLLLAGGGVKISKAERELSKFVELTGIPVVTTIMGKGAIPSDSPLFYGNVGIHGSFGANIAVDKCDLLLSVGVRFNDRIAGSKENFAKHAKIIHIDIDPSTVSRNILADIPILGDAKKVLSLLTENAKPLKLSAWIKDLDELKSAYPVKIANDKLNPQMIIEKLNTLFDDIIVATDVGQNQLWTTQFLKLNESRRLLTSGGFGTMGFGLPAAIGAKLANPKTPVVAIVGDGGFQMNVQELATAVINGLPIIICLLNNCWLGNVRQWQELYYGKRYQSTCLRRRATCPTRCVTMQECPAYVPSFQKLADSYEVKYRRVTSKEEIDEAFAFAMQQTEYPTLLEFMIDEEENVYPIILPGKDLSTVKFSKE